MNSNNKNIAVVGGGITGLAAAYYLHKQIQEENLPYNVLLIECTTRLGGKMQTVVRDGFIIERGPDSFLSRKTSIIDLAKELGIEDTLVPNSMGKSYILARERLHSIPDGAVMGIPTEIAPFVTSGLFSIFGKMRAAYDFILPRSKPVADQALGPFFRRRLGNEVVDNLIEPLLSGIYAGDLDKLSIMSTFPDMYAMEQESRSLVLGAKKNKQKAPKLKTAPAPGKRKGMFSTFKHGMQSLADAIEGSLPANQILKGTRVEEISKSPVDTGYLMRLHNGTVLPIEAAIITTPHQTFASMFPNQEFLQPLKQMPSTSVATVSMAFNASAIKQDIDGTGFLVSRKSDYAITGCTWTHKKWPHSTPDGKVLLRCFVGKGANEAIIDLSDEQIEQIVLDDLNKIMKITEKPDFTIITRWKESMPQYTVGHTERLRTIKEKITEELPGIYFGGSSYEGIGIPDCIDQGVVAKEKVIDFLHASNVLMEEDLQPV